MFEKFKENNSNNKVIDFLEDYLDEKDIKLKNSINDLEPFMGIYYIQRVPDTNKDDLQESIKILLQFYTFLFKEKVISKEDYDNLPKVLKDTYEFSLENLNNQYADLSY